MVPGSMDPNRPKVRPRKGTSFAACVTMNDCRRSSLTIRQMIHQGPVMAKKKGEKREKIRLVCTEDGGKHYVTTTKNKQNTQGKLELMKYNPVLRKVTLHREKK